MTRKKIAAGNWKMFKTPDETKSFFVEFAPLFSGSQAPASAIACPEVVFFIPAYDFAAAVDAVKAYAEKPKIGAQNIFHEREGAFTGELSPIGVKSAGATYVLIGHSERRSLFFESDEFAAKKVRAAVECGLTPMLCVGETLKEREAGSMLDVVSRQIIAGLSQVNPDARFVIAYEPVWAIGTGKVATNEQAEEAHAAIRRVLEGIFSEAKAEATSILYGGSVKPDNAGALAQQPNIDGFLVGGASLKARDFASIVEKLNH